MSRRLFFVRGRWGRRGRRPIWTPGRQHPVRRAAAAVGVDGLFIETHDNPAEALSDGPNMIALDDLEQVLADAKAIDAIGRREA